MRGLETGRRIVGAERRTELASSMYRPVFFVTACAAGAAAATSPAGLAFAGGRVPQLKNAAGPAATATRPALRNAAVQLRAFEEQDGWMRAAQKSVASSFFAASIAVSGFMGVVPAVPVHAELAPEARLAQATDYASGNFLLAEDSAAPAIKVGTGTGTGPTWAVHSGRLCRWPRCVLCGLTQMTGATDARHVRFKGPGLVGIQGPGPQRFEDSQARR